MHGVLPLQLPVVDLHACSAVLDKGSRQFALAIAPILADALVVPAPQPARRSALMPDAVPFEGVTLGPPVGRGSFGRVYRGTWDGRAVAVKVRH